MIPVSSRLAFGPCRLDDSLALRVYAEGEDEISP